MEHDASETVDSGKSGSMRQLSLLDTPKAEPRQRLRDASDHFFDALEGNPVAVLGGHGELAIAVGDKEIVYTGLTPKLVDRLLKAKFVIAPDVKALLHTHADWGRIPPENGSISGSPATFWSRRTATTAGPSCPPAGARRSAFGGQPAFSPSP